MIDIPDGALLLEPRELYDQALIRFDSRPDGTVLAVYSADRCVEALMQAEGWDREEALDWFHYNTGGCEAGELGPVFEWDRDADYPEEDPDDITD